MQWYYVRQQKRFGPVEETEVQKLISSGTLTPQDYVWNATMGAAWAHIADVPALASHVPAAKPAPLRPLAPKAAPAAVAAVAPLAAAAQAPAGKGGLKLAAQKEEARVEDPIVEERAAAVQAERATFEANRRKYWGYSCPHCGETVHRTPGENAHKWFGIAGVIFTMAFGALQCPTCGEVARSEFPPRDRMRLTLGSLMLVITSIVVFIFCVWLVNVLEN